jgi:hypothetical protein
VSLFSVSSVSNGGINCPDDAKLDPFSRCKSDITAIFFSSQSKIPSLFILNL